MTGEVKWFNPSKEFGFIYPDDKGKDIFLHVSVLHAAGCKVLKPGERVLIKAFSSGWGHEACFLSVICESAKNA